MILLLFYHIYLFSVWRFPSRPSFGSLYTYMYAIRWGKVVRDKEKVTP